MIINTMQRTTEMLYGKKCALPWSSLQNVYRVTVCITHIHFEHQAALLSADQASVAGPHLKRRLFQSVAY